MIRNNYHTHTFRCGHAIGEDEDYVLEAIGQGMQTLGFSDHVMLEGVSQVNVRGEFEMTEDYFSSIRGLEDKYKERIRILLGFEAEPFPDYFSYYEYLLKEKKIDYLILGNHCELEHGRIKYFFSKATTKEDIVRYKDTLIKGMETGLFVYVAHPDYFMGGYGEFDRTCRKVSEEICDASIALNIPLEFNFAAIRRGKVTIGEEERYLYPHVEFWKIAKKKGCKVILGLDAHAPMELSTDKNDAGLILARDLDLDIINELDKFKPYQEEDNK